MRRNDKALAVEETIELLDTCEYGTLSTVDDSGQPYGVPLNYVYMDKSLYFHCALEGHKLDNLIDNDRVSFCVVGRTRLLPAAFSTEYESVIVTGKASVVQGEERYQALLGLVEKYSPEFVDEGRKYITRFDDETSIVKIAVVSMTGKAQK